jgi:hypothetical protein
MLYSIYQLYQGVLDKVVADSQLQQRSEAAQRVQLPGAHAPCTNRL